jgi:hypothetical protein
VSKSTKKVPEKKPPLPLPFQTGKKYGIFGAQGVEEESVEDDRQTEAENRNVKNLPTIFAKKQEVKGSESSTSSSEEIVGNQTLPNKES